MRARSRRHRRGAEAVEFALVFPVFVTLLAGTFDYGMLFFTQFQVNAELHHSLRWGSLQTPSDREREVGGCSACLQQADADAEDTLEALGIDLERTDIETTLVQMDGHCSLVLEAAIPHTPLVGLFSTPETYVVRTSTPAQQVTLCD
ncbi:MAG: pilus assembly protein [Deltaproteobacteria bacterium]|nr:MAG: pilus assembly protein [Deltaproteobacteria bacterium]